jgi:hypothetical protein
MIASTIAGKFRDARARQDAKTITTIKRTRLPISDSSNRVVIHSQARDPGISAAIYA